MDEGDLIVLGFWITYILVGWNSYSWILAISRRFMKLKKALMLTLVISILTFNLLGVIRSTLEILKLPPVDPQ